MASQIDVVDINDNTVTEEVKEVKPKKQRAKAKVQPEPVKEEISPLGQEVTTEIEIPPGISEGMQLKIQGEGNEGPFNGVDGDLLVLIEEEKSENLIRDGINIHHELYINISEAILGCKKEIPTINGKVQISIPSGVDNGKRIIEIKLPFRPDLKASPDTKHPIDVIEIVPNIAIIEK